MTESKEIFGDESENDWYRCVDFESCGHIGVHPRGQKETCPNCNNNLEKYTGPIYVCTSCSREYVGQGDAEDCCA